MPNQLEKRTIFLAIIGRPNVGKSSLLNALLKEKIAIVSNKPQTTRTRIMGILTKNETQIVFIDTPGLHHPKTHLGQYMVKSIHESIGGVDACILVVEAGKQVSKEEIQLIEKLKELSLPAVLVINKIDLLSDKTILMDQISNLSKLFAFEAIVPISAKLQEGTETLEEELKKLTYPSEHFFPDDTITDQPERVLASEIIREKLLRFLNQEVPHGIAVSIERMKQRKNQLEIMDIDAVIFCEKESHKGIIIGKNGSVLKRVGRCAREDMENFFCCKINLQLWVKVKEDWRNRDQLLRSLGYRESDFDL